MESYCFHNGTLLTGQTRFEKGGIITEGNKILDVFSERRLENKKYPPGMKSIDVGGCYIAPGLIDTHIHGTGGFGTDDGTAEAVLKMSEILPRMGVTGFLPTVYPQPLEVMIKTIKEVKKAVQKEAHPGSKILGMHLEGPFLSPQRPGVQLPEYMLKPDIAVMERLLEAGGEHIVNMTVAPELKGMRELALFCINRNIVLQAGHTDALYENILEGIQAGILHSTHFFNAMSRLHHRNPGTVGAILIHPEISCEIIADGRHVHKDLVKLLLRNKPKEHIVLITDALKPTAQTEGVLLANGEEVYRKDKIFLRKKDDVIAGSSLTMIEGVKNLVSYDVPVEQAVMMGTANPARIHGIRNKGLLMPNYDADLVVFDRDFSVRYTVVEGSMRYEA